MARTVEVSLRIPNMKVRAKDENGYPLDHATVRFKKMIEVPAIPKAGESLQLTSQGGATFEAKVVRSDWVEDRQLFVVACQYANRSISQDQYEALINDPEWEMKPLI
jgi:hypothetical protein